MATLESDLDHHDTNDMHICEQNGSKTCHLKGFWTQIQEQYQLNWVICAQKWYWMGSGSKIPADDWHKGLVSELCASVI